MCTQFLKELPLKGKTQDERENIKSLKMFFDISFITMITVTIR